MLQQKVRRKQKKISTLTELFSDLTSKKLVNNEAASNLNEVFSGLTLELIKNHLFDQDREGDTVGRRHNDEAKKFSSNLSDNCTESFFFISH